MTATSLILSAVLICALVLQFGQKRYVAWSYWLAVVLISIVGMLVTDNLVDNFGVSLVTTMVIFTVALADAFAVWFAAEKTLSNHAIFTTICEAFYWPSGISFLHLIRPLDSGWPISSPGRLVSLSVIYCRNPPSMVVSALAPSSPACCS